MWDGLPRIEKVVDQSLFPDLSREPEGKFLSSPHTQKTVYYSSFRHAIVWFSKVFPNLAAQPPLLPGLLFCITVSPAPQHYWNELKRIIENPQIFADLGHPSVANMEARTFTQCLYDHLFLAKRQRQSYQTVNRHQPSHNKKARGFQMENSVDAIARLIYELNQIPAGTLAKQLRYYHCRSLAVMKQSSPTKRVDVWRDGSRASGVLGAGSLTSQHILGVAAGVGAIPDCLLLCAEIAEGTASWGFLASFGLDEKQFPDHSETILAAICHNLRIHRVQAEELCCATNQVVSKSKERPSEWIPPGAPVIRCIPRPTRRTEGGEVNEGSHVELLFPDGTVTTLPSYPINFDDPFFPRSLSAGVYWNINAEYKLAGMKYQKKRGPQAGFFFPLISPCGVGIKEARAAGLLGVPVPSDASVLYCRDRLIKLVADFDDAVRYILGKYYRTAEGEKLIQTLDSSIFHVEERLLKMDCHGRKMSVVAKRETRPTKRQRREGAGWVYVTVYSYAVKLGGGKLFRPKPDFPLREDYFVTDGSASYQDIGSRWFKTKWEAKQYCSLAFLANADPTASVSFFRFRPGFGDKPVLLPRSSTQMESNPSRGGRKKKKKGKKGEEERRAEVRVHVYTTRQDRPSQVPKVVSVTFESGARVFFLTNGSGARVSGLLFHLPFPTLGGKLYESILEHPELMWKRNFLFDGWMGPGRGSL